MSTWSFVDNIQESRCVDQSGWLFQDGKKDGADKKGTGKSLAEEGGRGKRNMQVQLRRLAWLIELAVANESVWSEEGDCRFPLSLFGFNASSV